MIEVDGKEIEYKKNLSISDLLEIFENSKFCAAVRLNGKLVSSPDFKNTIIEDNSKIQFLPLVAGG